MLRFFRFTLLLCPLLFALGVLVDTPLHRLPRSELFGVVAEESRPKLSLRSFWSSEFQPAFERWFEEQLSFKPLMVRTDNTLNLVAFHEISAHTGIPIVLGERDTLFELNYINNANAVSQLKGDPPPKTGYTVLESARKMGRATRAFQRMGIDFLVLMYPSKASIMYDRIPPRYRLAGGLQESESGYRDLLSALRREGVPVIDSVEVFRELSREPGELRLFNRGGTHWTEASACRVAQRVVAGLPSLAGSELRCALGPSRLAEGADRDLASLINVWDNQRFLEPTPRSRASLAARLPGGPRHSLIIGTSFSDILVRPLQKAGVLRAPLSIRYYRHTDAPAIPWKRLLRGKSVVIFEQWQWSYLTVNLTDFVDDLEAYQPQFARALRRVDAAP